MSIPGAWNRAGAGSVEATARNATGAGISVPSPLAGSVDITQAGTVKLPLSASPAMQTNWAPTPTAGLAELPKIPTNPEPLQVIVKPWERSIVPMASWPVQEAGLLGMVKVELKPLTTAPPDPLSTVYLPGARYSGVS